MSERYFSRISLRESASDASAFWKAFRDPFSLHASIWELFSDNPDRRRDFLYRVMDDRRPPTIYAVSARLPITQHPLWAVDAKEYRPRLLLGMRLEFSLRANPVVARDGKRHDVVMDAKKSLRTAGEAGRERLPGAAIVQDSGCRWLEKRAESLGFRVLTVRADAYRQHCFSKPKQRNPLKFSTVDFSGFLEVLDPDRFMVSLLEGIGHAKGFGCGMLMVKRAG